MIVLFTDFGIAGPYVGQMKNVIASIDEGITVIDLFHDAPSCETKYSSYLLAAYTPTFRVGTIFVAVVDPGVGSKRLPLILKADGKWFLGPDNGLFEIIIRRSSKVEAFRIPQPPELKSASFHGRDVFAPAAARIAIGTHQDLLSQKIDPKRRPDWPDQLPEVIYLDHFGNAITGLLGSNLDTSAVLVAREKRLMYARVFSEVPQGQAFWYKNSNNLVEIAVNKGRADILGIKLGTAIKVFLDEEGV
jgi:S-adenosylmethionine hydrolase